MLLSSPQEEYIVHIERVQSKLDQVFPVFRPTLIRILNCGNENDSLKETFDKMVIFHDLGKLTKKWQKDLGTYKKLPSHAPIGAAYLWKILPDGLKEPVCFAVAIHHTDRGLLGDNIERPDVQAINEYITDYSGNLVWDDQAKELGEKYFPADVANLNVNDLKIMARGLRFWARGDSILNQHKKRLQASLAHHIIKLCDWAAARDRKEYEEKHDKDYYGGWLMAKQIGNYVDAIGKRME